MQPVVFLNSFTLYIIKKNITNILLACQTLCQMKLTLHDKKKKSPSSQSSSDHIRVFTQNRYLLPGHRKYEKFCTQESSSNDGHTVPFFTRNTPWCCLSWSPFCLWVQVSIDVWIQAMTPLSFPAITFVLSRRQRTRRNDAFLLYERVLDFTASTRVLQTLGTSRPHR